MLYKNRLISGMIAIIVMVVCRLLMNLMTSFVFVLCIGVNVLILLLLINYRKLLWVKLFILLSILVRKNLMTNVLRGTGRVIVSRRGPNLKLTVLWHCRLIVMVRRTR